MRWRSNWWSLNVIDQRTPASKIITMANWLISVTEVSQILRWLFCNTLSGVCPLEIVHISNFHADLTSCYIRRHHIVKIQLEESQATQQWGRVHGFYKHWVECALRNPKYLGRRWLYYLHSQSPLTGTVAKHIRFRGWLLIANVRSSNKTANSTTPSSFNTRLQ